MATHQVEYEVVYSGTLERHAVEMARLALLAAAAAQSRDIDGQPNDANARTVVFRYLRHYPNCSMQQIAVASTLSRQATSRAIHELLMDGAIWRSSWPRSGGVLYAVRG